MRSKLRHVFSSESNRALFARPGRGFLVYGSAGVLLAASLLLQHLVPWWLFIVAGAFIYVGWLFVGSFWADKDRLEGH